MICFGFFDGDVDTPRSASAEQGYEAQMKAVAPYIESVGADGVSEVVEDYAVTRPSAP